MDIAVAGVASSVQLNTDGSIESARIALAAVGPIPILVVAANEFLVGKQPNDQIFSEAANLAAEAASPIDDMRGTADYRRHLCDVMTRRVLGDAITRARGGNVDAH